MTAKSEVELGAVDRMAAWDRLMDVGHRAIVKACRYCIIFYLVGLTSMYLRITIAPQHGEKRVLKKAKKRHAPLP